MKDYYKVLGVSETATQEEIKSAYRKLAVQHHPDKGGDEERFKEVGEAYDTLKDPQKKANYDAGRTFKSESPFRHGGPHFNNVHFDNMNVDDILKTHFHNFFRKAPDTIIHLSITLEDAFKGKVQNINVPHMHQSFELNIPPGVEDGMTFVIRNGGQTHNPNIEPGNLIVRIVILPHTTFIRSRDNLEIELDIDVIDCILGTTRTIRSIDGKELKITIPPGTQQDKRFKIPGYGMKNAQKSAVRGDMFVRANIIVPKNITPKQRELLESFKAESK